MDDVDNTPFEDVEAELKKGLSKPQQLFRKFWQQPPVRVAILAFVLAVIPAAYAVFDDSLGSTYLFVDRSESRSDPLTREFFSNAVAPNTETPVATMLGSSHGTENRLLNEKFQEQLNEVTTAANGAEKPYCKLFEVGGSEERGKETAPKGAGLICSDGKHEIFRIKNVGYLPALNWSLALVVLFPLALYLIFRSVREIMPSFYNMRDLRMFADPDFSKPNGRISEPIVLGWQRAFAIGLGGFAIGFFVVVGDFSTVVSSPYAQASKLEQSRSDATAKAAKEVLFPPDENRLTYEYDWSISAVFGQVYTLHYERLDVCLEEQAENSDPVRCDAPENLKAYGKTLDYETNAFFAGYVYLLLAFIIGLILAYYGVVAAIGWTVESVVHDQVHGRGGGKRRFNLMVVPGLASEDRRAGFENFSRFLTFLMGATLVNYFALYFMRLQNLYMRNHDYSSLPEFMFRDIVDPVEKLFSSIKNAGELDTEFVAEAAGDYTGLGDLVNILDPGMNDSQAYLGIFVLLIVYAVVSIVFFSATSDLARQARNNLRRLLSEPNGEDKAKRYYGANGTDVSARLEAMSIWPVAWPNLRNLLRYLGIGIAFLIFYRIWMIWLASILLRFLKSGNISDEPKETAKAKA